MRGTGLVGVNGTNVYAYFLLASNSVRVRLSVDETDRLGILDGLRVRVTLPGKEALDVFVKATNRIPPYVWLDLEPLTRRSIISTAVKSE
jgi:hypothetical protein